MASLLSSGVPFLLPPDPILKDIFATIKVFPRQELPFYAMDAGFWTKSEKVDLLYHFIASRAGIEHLIYLLESSENKSVTKALKVVTT